MQIRNFTNYLHHLRQCYPYVEDDTLYCCINEPLAGTNQDEVETNSTFTFAEITKDVQRHPFRYQIYRCVTPFSETALRWALCGHRVNHGAIAAHTQRLPRYAFRVYSDTSAGTNTRGHFQSEREKQGTCAEFEAMKEDDTQDSLIGHMSVRKKNFHSPWISLTFSHSWLEAEALRLLEAGCQNLYVAIIDTWNIDGGAHLMHAGALLRAYNVDQSLPYSNMSESVVLVWKELKAPMAVMSLAEYQADILTDGRLQPGYSTLQPFHYKSLTGIFLKMLSVPMVQQSRTDDSNDQNEENQKIGGRRFSKFNKPAQFRKNIFKDESWEEFREQKLQEYAPKTYHKFYRACRLYQGKQAGVRNLRNFRCPLAGHQLGDFIALVERMAPAIEFQLPMLLLLLSTCMQSIEYDSVIEAIAQMSGDDPILQSHEICIVRGKASTDLPEVTAFERLYKGVCEAVGIPVVEDPEVLRNFWVLDSPHTKMPEIQADSEKLLDLIEGKERKRKRLEEEAALQCEQQKIIEEKEARRAEVIEKRVREREARKRMPTSSSDQTQLSSWLSEIEDRLGNPEVARGPGDPQSPTYEAYHNNPFFSVGGVQRNNDAQSPGQLTLAAAEKTVASDG